VLDAIISTTTVNILFNKQPFGRLRETHTKIFLAIGGVRASWQISVVTQPLYTDLLTDNVNY